MTRGKRYRNEKKKHGGDRKSEESSGHSDHLKTAERIGEQLGVSAVTIRRDALAALRDELPHLAPLIDIEIADCEHDLEEATR